MQKSVINFTAFHLNDEETKKFVEIFKSIDENNDGVLSMEEIRKGVEECKFDGKINADDVVNMFNEMDIDKNGLVNYTEFVSALMDYEKSIKQEHLIACFQNYDADHSGKISFKEFCKILRPQNEKERKELKELYDRFDDNGDGEIDIDEFIQGFKKSVN